MTRLPRYLISILCCGLTATCAIKVGNGVHGGTKTGTAQTSEDPVQLPDGNKQFADTEDGRAMLHLFAAQASPLTKATDGRYESDGGLGSHFTVQVNANGTRTISFDRSPHTVTVTPQAESGEFAIKVDVSGYLDLPAGTVTTVPLGDIKQHSASFADKYSVEWTTNAKDIVSRIVVTTGEGTALSWTLKETAEPVLEMPVESTGGSIPSASSPGSSPAPSPSGSTPTAPQAIAYKTANGTWTFYDTAEGRAFTRLFCVHASPLFQAGDGTWRSPSHRGWTTTLGADYVMKISFENSSTVITIRPGVTGTYSISTDMTQSCSKPQFVASEPGIFSIKFPDSFQVNFDKADGRGQIGNTISVIAPNTEENMSWTRQAP